MTEQKGVGDIIHATSILINQGFNVSLKIVGKGELETFKNLAQKLNIQDKVTFTGLVIHKNIIGLMRDADAVLITSHHEYPEG